MLKLHYVIAKVFNFIYLHSLFIYLLYIHIFKNLHSIKYTEIATNTMKCVTSTFRLEFNKLQIAILLINNNLICESICLRVSNHQISHSIAFINWLIAIKICWCCFWDEIKNAALPHRSRRRQYNRSKRRKRKWISNRIWIFLYIFVFLVYFNQKYALQLSRESLDDNFFSFHLFGLWKNEKNGNFRNGLFISAPSSSCFMFWLHVLSIHCIVYGYSGLCTLEEKWLWAILICIN